MTRYVLGIGYPVDEHETVRKEWWALGVDFHFAQSVDEAELWLGRQDYVCITIFADHIEAGQLRRLQLAKTLPVVLLTPGMSLQQRVKHIENGAGEFIKQIGLRHEADLSGKDDIQFYLDLPAQDKENEPLTIITVGDLYFCLEYRSVKVRGQEIALTPFEFAALYLFLSNPKRTLTFEIISARVWGEEYIDNPRKAVNNLISRLRNKLKIAPDVQDHIGSIHGVGYRYDAEK